MAQIEFFNFNISVNLISNVKGKTWKGEKIKKSVKNGRKVRHLPDSCLQTVQSVKSLERIDIKFDSFSISCRSRGKIMLAGAPRGYGQKKRGNGKAE